MLEIYLSTGAHRAMWGYGVDPPADIDPHLGLVSRISARRGRHCSRRPSPRAWVVPRRSWVLWCQCPAQPANWPLWHRLCHQDCPGNGSFWPLVVIGDHPARDMKGPPQVHPRSVKGRRKLARTGQLEAGLSVAGRCILQSIRRPGRRGLLPGVSVKAIPRSQQGSRDCPAIPWAMRGPDPRPTSDLPGAWRALQRGRRGHRNPGASGAVNRWLRPDSVRHLSVTTATQRLTAIHHET